MIDLVVCRPSEQPGSAGGNEAAEYQQEIKIDGSCNAHGGSQIGTGENGGVDGLVHQFRDSLGTGEREHVHGNVYGGLYHHDGHQGIARKPHSFIDQPGHEKHGKPLQESKSSHNKNVLFVGKEKQDSLMIAVGHME